MAQTVSEQATNPTQPAQQRSKPTELPDVAQLATRVTTCGPRGSRPSYAPFTGDEVGEVPICTAEDVEFAARRAREAQERWKQLSVAERKGIFLRFGDLVLDNTEVLLDLVQHETGKSRLSAFEEVADVAATARYYANTAARYLAPQRRWGLLPGLTSAREFHHPKGLVGIISPWNYPLTLPIGDMIPALLAGNGIVLKPDAQTPFSALLGVQLLVEAGLPSELVQVVTGAGRELGGPMIQQVDYLMFTGSTATGRTIAKQCGERLIGFSAELGGKNPLIVCDDADLEKTVYGVWRSCFSNTGQLCISIERIYVADEIYDRFVPAFAERTRDTRIGASYDYSFELGSLISADQLKVVTEHVEDAKAKGAKVLAGGNARPDLGPYFYEPTVLEGVTDEMRLARDETFGPVVSVYRVRDMDEAVRLANDTCYGLNASIWTSDLRAGQQLAKRINAGTVNINEGYAAAWASHDAPMGGMKDSGVGRRHGREGILKYTESQTVATQRVFPLAPPPGMAPETFVKIMTMGLRLMRRTPFIP